MSHDLHASGSDGHKPPATSGTWGGVPIPNGALLFVLITILLSIMQGSFVVAASPWGRVWPSENSAKVVLPPANLTVTNTPP